MAHSTDSYQVARVVDSRIAVHAPRVLVAAAGPASSTFQSVQPNDPTSQNPVFSIQLPSPQTGLARTVYWRMSGSLTITGTNLNALTASNKVAFRQFPIQSACSNLSAQINDTVSSLGSLNQYVSGLAYLGLSTRSTAASCVMNAAFDAFAEYDASAGTLSPFNPPAETGRNDYADESRTTGITSITVNGGLTSAVITFDIAEPLLLQPFSYGSSAHTKAIFGLNTVQISATLSNVHRMLSLSLSGGATVSAVALSISQQSLECNFLTPDDRSLVERPLAYTYHFAQAQYYANTLTAGAVGAGTTATGSSAVVEFPVIPSKILVFCTYSATDLADATQSLANTFWPIQSISCQMGTRSGLLANATPRQLWEISRRAGSEAPYWQQAGLGQFGSATVGTLANSSGAPLIIDVSQDLSLPDGVCPGMAQRITFAVNNITVRNNQSTAFTSPRLVIVALTEGLLTNKDGTSSITLGGVPGANDEHFQTANTLESAALREQGMDGGYGGALMGGSMRGFMKFLHGVGNVAKTIGKPLLKMATPVVSMLAPEAAPALMAANAALGQGVRGGARMQSKLYRAARV